MSGTYRRLLRAPHARPLVLAAFVGRLPIGMLSLAVLLLVEGTTGSYALAGLAAAVLALSEAVAAPVQGRLIDRFGQTPSLLVTAAGFPLALAALVLVAEGDPPPAALVALAGVSGLLLPPLMASMRTLWARLVPSPRLLDSAYALETVLQELFFLGGPLIVAACVAVGSPSLAVGAAGVFGCLGTLGFAASPVSRGWRAEPRRDGSWTGPLAAAGLRTLVASGLLTGFVFGTVEVTVPAFAEREGAAAVAGLLLAGIAAGSLVGGLWYGARTWRAPAHTRYVVCLAVFAFALLPALAATSPPVMLAALVLSGLAIAPTFATSYSLIGRLAPPGTTTEAFAWLSTSIVSGLALGNAAAGALVEATGVRVALLAALGAATLSAAVAFARRGTLTGSP